MAVNDSNVWIIQELFVEQEADNRRTFLLSSIDKDRCNNSGSRHKSLTNRVKIKFILSGYDTRPKSDLVIMLAQSI